jgi:hypothetical protein
MPFRRPVSQTGFDDDPSPKRLKTSHNGSPSANAWPPLVSNIGESQRYVLLSLYSAIF